MKTHKATAISEEMHKGFNQAVNAMVGLTKEAPTKQELVNVFKGKIGNVDQKIIMKAVTPFVPVVQELYERKARTLIVAHLKSMKPDPQYFPSLSLTKNMAQGGFICAINQATVDRLPDIAHEMSKRLSEGTVAAAFLVTTGVLTARMKTLRYTPL